jgi:hypothetical protein
MPSANTAAAHRPEFSSEDIMNSDLFDKPVFVRAGKYSIQEIGSVMDAIEFMEEWPVHDHGVIHSTALSACYAAYDGRKPVDAARKAFEIWARRENVLSDVEVPTWMVRANSNKSGASA